MNRTIKAISLLFIISISAFLWAAFGNSLPPQPINITVPSTNSDGNYTVSWEAGSTDGTYLYASQDPLTSYSLISNHTNNHAHEAPDNSSSLVSTSSIQINKYVLEESKNNGAWVVVVNSTPLGDFQTWNNITGQPNGTYKYRVKACPSFGFGICSPYTTSTNIVVSPSTPPSLTSDGGNGNGGYTLSWGQSSGTVSGYQLQQREVGGSWSTVYDGSSRSQLVTLNFGQFEFKVRAYDSGVYSSYSSLYSINYSGVIIVPDEPLVEPTVPVNQSVSSLNGSGGVSGGAASYSIPITLPPGRAGMAPSVSLSYSSRGGNGVVGMGWSLGIGSAISRCARTEAQDDRIGGVTYHNTTDRACLNGQRLISVTGSTTTAEYRTEIDSFQKISQIGNLNDSSSRFEVISKGGLKQYFGTTSNSRVIPSGAPATITWMLEKEQDQSGNTIEYNYQQNADGEVLLDEVLYTGFNSTAGNRKVSFVYEDRDDRSSSYLSGGLTRQTERLKTIETYYGATLIRRYTLNYSYSLASGKSLLADVEECAYKNSIANCLPITEFNWHNKAIEYEVEKLGYISATTGNLNTQLQSENKIENVMPHGDRDGDGASDWKTWSMDAEGVLTDTHDDDQTTCKYNGLTHSLVCADVDFDRDGKTDSWKIENNILKIALSPNNWQNTLVPANNDSYIKLAADFNGDGWPDLVMYDNPQSYPRLTLYTHTQNISAPYSSNGQIIYSASGTSTDAQFVGDLDGNGLPDFIEGSFSPGFGSGSVPQAIPQTAFLTKLDASNNIYFDTINLTAHARAGTDYENYFNFFMDVNGDGLTDWLSWKSGNSTSISFNQGDATFTPWAALGAGASFAVRIAIIDIHGEPFDQNYPKYHASFRVLDINSDGRPELLVPGNRIVEACANLITTSPSGNSNPVVSFCGDELYGTIRTMPTTLQKYETPIQTSLYDDSIYEWDAIYFDENADGSYTARRESSGLIGSATQSAPISAFGNGLTDFLFTYRKRANEVTIGSGSGTPVGNNYGVYVNRNLGTADNEPGNALGCERDNSCLSNGDKRYELIDTLKSVVDTAMDNETRWSYRPLSSRDLDDAINGPLYEVTGFSNTVDSFNFTSSMYVVAAHETSDGIGGFNQTQYRYKDAVYDYKGRGFQGFRTIIVDNANDIRSVTDFKQTFPMAGQVESSRTCLVSDDATCSTNPISRTEITSEFKTMANSDIYWVLATETIQTNYDLNTRVELSEQTTSVAMSDTDLYGNLEKIIAIVNKGTGFGETKTTTDNVYFNPDESAWWVNKLNTSTITTETLTGSAVHNAALDPLKKVEKSFTWTANRQPDISTVEPKIGGGKTMVVNTNYNNRGLPTLVETYEQGLSSNKRTIISTYTDNGTSASSNGYFVYELTNDLNHVVTTLTHPETGLPEQVTDPNGLVTNLEYDPFGRVEKTIPAIGANSYVRYAWCDGGCDGMTDTNIQFKVTSYQAGAPETTVYKDQLGRVLNAKTQGFNNETIYASTTFDELGRTTFSAIPSFNQSESKGTYFNQFDALGRLIDKVVDQPMGHNMAVNYSYNGAQTVILATSDNHLIEMSRTHNGAGQLMQTIQTDNNIQSVSQYAYDNQGNPIVLQDANGNAIEAEYNALGQKLYVEDPNMGRKDFTYTGFGEVDTETDANDDETDYDYDILGRLTARKLNTNLEASFSFDSQCNGMLDNETREDLSGSDSFFKTYTYNDNCLPEDVTTNIDGADFTTSIQFDSYYGRPKAVTYPNELTVKTTYNSRGYATTIENAEDGYVYHEAIAMNAGMQLIEANKANGILNEITEYAPESGQMLNVRTSTTNGNTQRHRIDYTYASFGNLATQTVENMQNNSVVISTESYAYDDLHRLITSDRTIGGANQAAINYAYDKVGNFTLKDDYVNSYTYGNINKTAGGKAGPNAVRSIVKSAGGSTTYNYDDNGNLKNGDGKTLTYNAFNKPLTVAKNGITSTFRYGANQMRYKQVKTGLTAGTVTTVYIDKTYEEISQNGITKKRLYLGDTIITETVGGNDAGTETHFVHRDRLNSVVTITDETGSVVDNKSFDPFGKPRKGSFETVLPSTLKDVSFLSGFISAPIAFDLVSNRGFTDHEHLDEAELIHMNGRVYDYNLGRFLSVDPFIQSPGNSQSMNPYSYIMNNPLAGTDPSGYKAEPDVKPKQESVITTTSKTKRVSITGTNFKRTVTTVSASDGTNTVSATNSGGNVTVTISKNGAVTKGSTSAKPVPSSGAEINSQKTRTNVTTPSGELRDPTANGGEFDDIDYSGGGRFPGQKTTVAGKGKSVTTYTATKKQSNIRRPVGGWTTKDFLTHYFFGFGRAVDLGNVGLGEEFKNAPSVVAATKNFIESIMQGPVFNLSVNGTAHTNVTNVGDIDFTGWPSLFSIGDSNPFFMSASCTSGDCTFTFSLRDHFVDALDIRDQWNGNQDIGVPYQINYDWTEKRSYLP